MSKMPDSWEIIPLGEVIQTKKGKKPRGLGPESEVCKVPYITIKAFEKGIVDKYAPEQEATECKADDILLVWDGARSGLSGRGMNGYVGSTIARVRSDLANADYLYYFINSCYSSLNTQTKGVGIPHVNPTVLNQFEFPLPPLNEQIRIVDKLEELFIDLDHGVAELKAAQVKLSLYRQSLLKNAVDGSLTEKWRAENEDKISETGEQLLQRILKERRERWEQQKVAEFKTKGKEPPKDWQKKYPEPAPPDTSDLPELPQGWIWASLDMLGDIVSGVTKGTKRKTVVETRDVPYLRVANVQRGYLNLSEIKVIEATESDIKKYTLEPGDILFNEGGDRDKLGRGWVWYGEVDGCIHQNHVFRMRPFVEDLVSEFISHHGNTFGQRWFQLAGKQTTNLASINSRILKSFPVPVPSFMEQTAILEVLNKNISNIEVQLKTVADSLNQLVAQQKNILKSAFSGGLVPQEPDDEPASLLLERIRIEREEQAKKKIRRPKKRRVRRPKEIGEMVKKLEDILISATDWLPAQEAFQRCGITNGTDTDQIEVLYAELRELDKSGRLMVEAVTDSKGIKQYDHIKLAAEN